MKELVVISGKGGTGKTSLTACFAVLANHPVIADCDVDAADLHLVLRPRTTEHHDFFSGNEAVIRGGACTGCSDCLAHCRFDAIRPIEGPSCAKTFAVAPLNCEGCGVCVLVCPVGAIDFPERRCGEWMRSETRCGPMVHARLGASGENSGKLVSTVRQEARRIAVTGHSMILVDGPPGVGCPVIASITGSSLVLAVAEPTVSGAHDLERVLELARHFNIPAAVCVNKWDLNPCMTERIEHMARREGARVVGRIRYDGGVTRAQLLEKAAVEMDIPCAVDIREVWNAIALQEA